MHEEIEIAFTKEEIEEIDRLRGDLSRSEWLELAAVRRLGIQVEGR